MESEHIHKILIVDDEEQIGKVLGHIVQTLQAEYIVAENGEKALKEIKTAKKPFSLIICDQRMGGMDGTEFLNYAKQISPDTIRFLMTAYSEMETILNSVNQGAVQRYISKPCDQKELIPFIKNALKCYEVHHENEKLSHLSQKQNKKLYDLNCELMATAKGHTKAIQDLDKEITQLEKKIKEADSGTKNDLEAIMDRIETYIKEEDSFNQEKINILFSHVIKDLHQKFNHLAKNNEFKMPQISSGDAS
ncbi:MAG: response regulator [Desulfobacteraceae bacterium]|nr:response regulator [Desulfobacteraceae bacterium]